MRGRGEENKRGEEGRGEGGETHRVVRGETQQPTSPHHFSFVHHNNTYQQPATSSITIMDAQADRKKLIAKQQNELKVMEKDVKKKKVRECNLINNRPHKQTIHIIL